MVTNPQYQKAAATAPLTGAKALSKQLSSGLATARDSSAEILAKRRQDNRQKREEKEERRALREELKREREQIREMRMKGGDQTEELDRKDQELRGQEDALGPDEPVDESAEEDAQGERRTMESIMSAGRLVTSPVSKPASSFGPRNLPPPLPSAGSAAKLATSSHSQNGALASVQCLDLSRIQDDSLASSASSAATTTFSPWPGLLLTSTLVVSSGDARDLQVKAEALAALVQQDEQKPNSTQSASAATGPVDKHDSSPPTPARAAAPVPTHGISSSAGPLPSKSLPPHESATGITRAPPAPTSAAPAPAPAPAARPMPAPPARPAPPDPTAPPPFGTVVDTTAAKKKGGMGKLFGK